MILFFVEFPVQQVRVANLSITDVNIVGRNVHLIKKNTEALVAASNKIAQEEKVDKTK